VPDLFGSPKAVKKWEAFYDAMVKDYGMHRRPGFLRLSRGGLYCMNWAAAHPDRTLAVYLDNAVCDFKSWPGGTLKKLGTGKGSEGEWKRMLAAYEFKSDEEAIGYKLAPLAKVKIPLLLVYGDKDTVVPHAENSELVTASPAVPSPPLDQVADLAVLLRRHVLRVGGLPLLPPLRVHQRALVPHPTASPPWMRANASGTWLRFEFSTQTNSTVLGRLMSRLPPASAGTRARWPRRSSSTSPASWTPRLR
jgi:hypothetical protein